MKQLVIDFINAVRTGNGIRVALITYSTTAAVNFDFNEYLTITDIEAAIWGIPPMGDSTNTAHSIHKARMLFEDEARADVKKFMVVMSDGNANVQKDQVILQANLARQQEVKIFAVGMFLHSLPGSLLFGGLIWKQKYIDLNTVVTCIGRGGVQI